MRDSIEQTSADTVEEVEQFDAIIIGAGLTGLYQLYRLRQLGLTVRVFDDGAGVGGTWYWNRYPGARFDSESYTYGYSFSEELLQEWDWKEHYSGQPENERYLNYVADKFDLRRDIEFNARVASAVYDEREDRWQVQTEDGRRASGQFLIAAVGNLSAGYVPDFEGIDSFQGSWCHTSRWPKEGMDLAGKRVGVVGTGATAVQLIPEIAKEVAHLTVFQRTPNYAVPAWNARMDPQYERSIKADYPGFRAKARARPTGFYFPFNKEPALDATPDERKNQYEAAWARGGLPFLGAYGDLLFEKDANEWKRGEIVDQLILLINRIRKVFNSLADNPILIV